MTRLVRLTLKNFKSFKKAEIPISKGFTAIVGSNGSGKSNILDALLFVLGITSLKTLRAGKLTDLVNTDARENYGKVDLIIKDAGKQYEVSRMIDKQGKSVYRLDGKRTTLNEISSLLTELGIDVSGHNIVTQGDITKIVEMSPIERREIIDNLAGLSEFDAKKEEAISELDKVDSKIKEATIILNERNTFLVELEQEMKAAKEYRDLEEEKKRTKATIISKELYALEKKMLDADNEITEMDKQKQIIESRIGEIRASLGESKKKSDDLAKQMIRESEKTYSTIGMEYEEKKAKLMLETEKTDLKKQQKAKGDEKIQANKELLLQAEKEKTGIEEKIKRLNAEKEEFEQKLKEIAKKKSSIEAVVKEKSTQLGREENTLDEINKNIEEVRKEMFDVEVIAKNWEKQKAFNEKKLSELRGEEETLETEIGEIDEKKSKITAHSTKDWKKVLADMEKKLSEALDQKNLFGTKKGHEEKALNELKKAISQCPTCETPLKEDKKSLLISQKEAIAKEFAKRESEHAIQMEEAHKEIAIAKEKIMLLAELSAEIAHEEGTKRKLEVVKTKIEGLTRELDSKGIEEQLQKRAKLNEKIEKLLDARVKIKEKVGEMKKENIFDEYSQAGRAFEELMQKRNVIEHETSELKSRLQAFSTKSQEAAKENSGLAKEIGVLENEIKEKEMLLEEIKNAVIEKEKELINAKKRHVSLEEEKNQSDKKIEKYEKEVINESGKIKKIEMRINEWNIEKSKLGVRQADLNEEAKAFEGIEPFSSKTLDECKERAEVIEKRLIEIGAVNMKAVDNFNELRKEVEDIQQKANRLGDERLAVLDMIDKIEVKRTAVFMECFNEINKNFQEIFFNFFNGEGNLSFTDQEKPLESGLMIDAKHKGGKLLNIDSMSGGEKTLTALAFMFAIQLYSPAPFYAFDEADAALDKENSLKMSNLVEKIAEKSQFIAITHNDVITKKAHQIIGVARGKDDSSVIGLKLKNTQDDELKEIKSNVAFVEQE
jgi:chromosome segregation protein